MARHYTPLDTGKSYATKEGAIVAADKKFGTQDDLTYIVMPIQTKKGERFVPVFIGERAMRAGVHFTFHVLG